MTYDYHGILAALGKAWKLEGMTFEEDSCDLLIDDRHALNIHKDEELERIILTGVVADELPDPVDYSLVLDLLDYALAPVFSAGPSIGRDSETGVLVAYVILPMRHLDEGSFPEAVARFLEFQLAMSERLKPTDASEREEPVPETSLRV